MTMTTLALLLICAAAFDTAPRAGAEALQVTTDAEMAYFAFDSLRPAMPPAMSTERTRSHCGAREPSPGDFFAASPAVDGSELTVKAPSHGQWGALVYLDKDDVGITCSAIEKLAGSQVRHLIVRQGTRRQLFEDDIKRLAVAIEKLQWLQHLTLDIPAKTSYCSHIVSLANNLPQLTCFTFRGFWGSPPLSLERLQYHESLESLFVSGEEVRLADIAKLKWLKALGVAGKVVDSFPGEVFAKMEKVEELFVEIPGKDGWSDIALGEMGRMPSLKKLHIAQNSLLDSNIEGLLSNRPIEFLSVVQAEGKSYSELFDLLNKYGGMLAGIRIHEMANTRPEQLGKLSKLRGIKWVEIGGIRVNDKAHNGRGTYITQEHIDALAPLPLQHLSFHADGFALEADALKKFAQNKRSIVSLGLHLNLRQTEHALALTQGLGGVRELGVSGPLEEQFFAPLMANSTIAKLEVDCPSFSDACAKAVSGAGLRSLTIHNGASLSSKGLGELFGSGGIKRLHIASCDYLNSASLEALSGGGSEFVSVDHAPYDTDETRKLASEAGAKGHFWPGEPRRLNRDRLAEMHRDVLKKAWGILLRGRFRDPLSGGYYSRKVIPPRLSRVYGGFELRYSSDSTQNKATMFAIVAFPLEFRKGMHAAYIDESGRLGVAEIESETVLEEFRSLEATSFDFRARNYRVKVNDTTFSESRWIKKELK
ncbi:MAG: hypothetical protein U5N86_05890 [Planctomycetota bacterium]|nr:hypothetical protein [Planctomycetota bacterium]